MEEKTTDALPQQDAPAAAEEEPQAPAAAAAPEAGAQEAGCEEAPPAAEDGGEDDALARHVRRVIRQAEALRPLYPDIADLFGDSEFVRLTSPDVGLDLRTAYEIVRKRGAVSARPAESGARSAAGAVPAADPSRLSKEERAEIRRRVKAGDRTISF